MDSVGCKIEWNEKIQKVVSEESKSIKIVHIKHRY